MNTTTVYNNLLTGYGAYNLSYCSNFISIFCQILENLEPKIIKETMSLIYSMNKNTYNRICLHRKEFEQIRKLDTEMNYTTQCIRGGWYELLIFLHKRGYPIDYHGSSRAAASNGHLNVLKYLHEIGYSFDSHVIKQAARNGHLECLKYLHEIGCEYDNSIILGVKSQTCQDYILEYM